MLYKYTNWSSLPVSFIISFPHWTIEQDSTLQYLQSFKFAFPQNVNEFWLWYVQSSLFSSGKIEIEIVNDELIL